MKGEPRHGSKKRQKPAPAPVGCARDRAIAAADERLASLKHRISLAALAAMRGAQDTPRLVRAALDEVDRARALLSELAEP